jgi:hypothetical protein
MKLTTIAYDNIKGRSGSHDLADINLIVGSNSAGKTAILDAIRLATTGRHPVLGASAPKIWQLSSGATMRVSARREDGAVLSRLWGRQGNGSIKHTLELPGDWDDTVANDAFSPAAFLASNAQQRAASLMRYSDAATDPSATAWLRETQRAWDVFLPVVDVVTDMRATVDALVETRRELKRDIKRHSETLKTLDDAEPPEGVPVSADDVSAMQAKVDGLRQREAELNIKLVTAKRAADQALILGNATWSDEDEDRLGKMSLLEQLTAENEATAKRLRQQLDDLLKSDVAAREKEALANIEDAKACPTCGAANEGWRDAVVRSLQHVIDRMQAGHDDAVETITGRIALLTGDQCEDLEQLRANIDEMRQRKANAKTLATLGPVLSGEAIESMAAGHADALAALQAANNELTTLRKQREQHVRYEATQQQRADCELAQRDATLALGRIEADIDKGRAIVANIAGEAARGLREAMERFAEALPANMDFEMRDMEVGLTDRHGWHPWEVLSGSEQCLLAFAITCALASRCVVKIALLDEVSTMEANRKARLMLAIQRAIDDGIIEQVVMVDHTPPMTPLDGINLIKVEDCAEVCK